MADKRFEELKERDRKAFELYESEVKRLSSGKGLRFSDEALRLKESAVLAVATALSRKALQDVTFNILWDSKRAANFKVAAEARDPVLLAAIAGPKAMANLSGLAVADRGGSGKPNFLEKVAADAARDHMALAKSNPKLAALREAQWQSQRTVMSRGFMAGAMREVSDTYVKSISQTIAASRDGRPTVAPVEGWRPEGAFRSMSTLSPQLAAGRTPVQVLSQVPKEFRDNPALERSRARAALAAQVADSRSGVDGSGLAFRQAFRRYYAATRNALGRAGERVGLGIDAGVERAARARRAAVAKARDARGAVGADARAVGRGVAAGGRAVRDGAAAGGRAVRDGAAAGGRAVRDGAAAGGRAVRDGAAAGARAVAAGGRAVRDGAAAGGRAVREGAAAGGRAVRDGAAAGRRGLVGGAALAVGGVVAGAAAFGTGVVRLASRAAARISDAVGGASRRTVVNPVATGRFKRQLKSHMKQGPEATKSFLEKTLRSSSGRAVAMKAGLDPLTVAAALGSRDLKLSMSGQSLGTGAAPEVPGARESASRFTSFGLSSPAAPPAIPDTVRQFADELRHKDRQVESRLPSVVPPGVSVNMAKERASAGSLQSDREFQSLREELCSRSAGYSSADAAELPIRFGDHQEELAKLDLENQRLKDAGETRDVTEKGHPNYEKNRDLAASVDLALERGAEAKAERAVQAQDFDESRRAAVSMLEDDWTADRGAAALEPTSGPDKRPFAPTEIQKQYAAERISDLRLDLSPAAQDDARRNGLESVDPKTANDRIVLREIDLCRQTIGDYDRQHAQERGRDDRSPASRDAVPVGRDAGADGVPAQARPEDGAPGAGTSQARAEARAAEARAAAAASEARSPAAPAVSEPAGEARISPSAPAAASAQPAPAKSAREQPAAFPAKPAGAAPAKPEAPAPTPAPPKAAAPAQTDGAARQPAAAARAAGPAPAGSAPASKPAAPVVKPATAPASGAPARAARAAAAKPSQAEPMVERQLASAIILRVAGKERRADNVIKQVVRNHGDEFATTAAREKVCRGAEDHARAAFKLKGRTVPNGTSMSLDPAKLIVEAPSRSQPAAPAQARAAVPGAAAPSKPAQARAGGSAAKPVKPAKRAAPGGGSPSKPGKAARSARSVRSGKPASAVLAARAARTAKAPSAGKPGSARAAAAGGGSAWGSADSPSFAAPNLGALKRGGSSDRLLVARPSSAAAAASPAARKDKGQERSPDGARRA